MKSNVDNVIIRCSNKGKSVAKLQSYSGAWAFSGLFIVINVFTLGYSPILSRIRDLYSLDSLSIFSRNSAQYLRKPFKSREVSQNLCNDLWNPLFSKLEFRLVIFQVYYFHSGKTYVKTRKYKIWPKFCLKIISTLSIFSRFSSSQIFLKAGKHVLHSFARHYLFTIFSKINLSPEFHNVPWIYKTGLSCWFLFMPYGGSCVEIDRQKPS